jgi:hypothetical protein
MTRVRVRVRDRIFPRMRRNRVSFLNLPMCRYTCVELSALK